MKKIINLLIASMGFLIFIALILLTALVKAYFVRYVLLIGGYIAIIIFAYGYLKYLKIIGNK